MIETATVHVKEVKIVKEGENAKGKWTLYGLVDGNEDFYTWFNNRDLYDQAKKLESGKAEIEFEPTDKGRNLKSVAAEATNGDTPALGTGAYVTGQKPPIEVRRIAAATAWKQAAGMAELFLSRNTGRETTPEYVREIAQGMVDHIFIDLLRKGRAMEDEDIPF